MYRLYITRKTMEGWSFLSWSHFGRLTSRGMCENVGSFHIFGYWVDPLKGTGIYLGTTSESDTVVGIRWRTSSSRNTCTHLYTPHCLLRWFELFTCLACSLSKMVYFFSSVGGWVGGLFARLVDWLAGWVGGLLDVVLFVLCFPIIGNELIAFGLMV